MKEKLIEIANLINISATVSHTMNDGHVSDEAIYAFQDALEEHLEGIALLHDIILSITPTAG